MKRKCGKCGQWYETAICYRACPHTKRAKDHSPDNDPNDMIVFVGEDMVVRRHPRAWPQAPRITERRFTVYAGHNDIEYDYQKFAEAQEQFELRLLNAIEESEPLKYQDIAKQLLPELRSGFFIINMKLYFERVEQRKQQNK